MQKLQIIFLILLMSIVFSVPAKAENKVLKVGVSENTPVAIVAEWPIGPNTQEGEHFSARIVEDVTSSTGELYIPKNSRVLGTVVKVKKAGPFRQNAKVDVGFEKIIFPDNITTLKINADGSIEKDKYATLKTAGMFLGETAVGAALGAVAGFKFAGVIASSTSTGSNIAIGAATGAGLAAVSFMARRGSDLDIHPGMPMTLNIIDLQSQDYKAQKLVAEEEEDQEITADIVKVGEQKVTVEIENKSARSIPLGNLKIVDALGYTVKPQIEYSYHGKKAIPANTLGKYNLDFSSTNKKTRYWLVLTDSFNKQEFFRKELKVLN